MVLIWFAQNVMVFIQCAFSYECAPILCFASCLEFHSTRSKREKYTQLLLLPSFAGAVLVPIVVLFAHSNYCRRRKPSWYWCACICVCTGICSVLYQCQCVNVCSIEHVCVLIAGKEHGMDDSSLYSRLALHSVANITGHNRSIFIENWTIWWIKSQIWKYRNSHVAGDFQIRMNSPPNTLFCFRGIYHENGIRNIHHNIESEHLKLSGHC